MKRSTKTKIAEVALVLSLACAAMVTCKPVKAAELMVSGFSHHLSAGDFDEVNPGVGVYQTLDENKALIGGTYHNSYGRQTVYGGVSTHIAGRGAVQLRLDWVLATGYQYDVIPGIVPVVEINTGRVTTRALLIPRVSEDTATAIGVQFRVRM